MLEIVGAVLLSTLTGRGPGSDATAYATVLFVLTTGAVGTLIGLRRPGNTIGWLLRLAAFGFATGSLLVVYVEVAVAQAGSLPVGPIAVWLGDLMFQLGFGVSATFLLLLFPTGRLPSPRWKLVGWIGGDRHRSHVRGGPVRPGRFRGPSHREPARPRRHEPDTPRVRGRVLPDPGIDPGLGGLADRQVSPSAWPRRSNS